MAADERVEALRELVRVPTAAMLAQTAGVLVTVAYAHLGAIPEVAGEADPEEARQAIDAIAALLPLVGGAVEPRALDELRGALAELQLAYARVAGAQAGPGGGSAGGPPPPSPERPPAPGPAGGGPRRVRREPPPRPPIWTPRGDV